MANESEMKYLHKMVAGGLNLGMREKVTYTKDDNGLGLAVTEPTDLKKEDFNSQICMRCAKQPAVEGDIFCLNCIKERARIEENIKKRKLDYEPVVKKDEDDEESVESDD